MPFVSITRLRVRAWRLVPMFLWHAFASKRQLQRSEGFLRGALSTAPGRVFWTASVWSDDAAMKRFRDAGAHKTAMPALLDMCDEASLAHWTQEGDEVPEPAAMLERVRSIGRTSKVRHPTTAHGAGQTVPDGRPPRPGRPFMGRGD
jgi:hypothetical protein